MRHLASAFLTLASLLIASSHSIDPPEKVPLPPPKFRVLDTLNLKLPILLKLEAYPGTNDPKEIAGVKDLPLNLFTSSGGQHIPPRTSGQTISPGGVYNSGSNSSPVSLEDLSTNSNNSWVTYEGIGSSYLPQGITLEKLRDLIGQGKQQKDGSNNDLLRFVAYAWGLNLTANSGRKPSCFCGQRRMGGVVPGHDDSALKDTLESLQNFSKLRLAEGTEALPNEFPWRVALQGGPNGVFCGGSIIHNRWVLTAARCLSGLDPNTTVLYVNAGDHDVTTVTETDNVVIRVKSWVIHPEYNGRTLDNNVALVRLERELQFRANIQPVCLPYSMKEEDVFESIVVGGGWGSPLSMSNLSTSPVMFKAQFPLLKDHHCQILSSGQGNQSLPANTICSLGPGREPCHGDIGSTIEFYNSHTFRYHAVGITSHGSGCGTSPGGQQPFVHYANISSYMSFIQNVTRASFCYY